MKDPLVRREYRADSWSFILGVRVEDEDGRGRPSAIDHQHLKILVKQNPCQSFREISQIMSVSISTISEYLNNLARTENSIDGFTYELRDKEFGILKCVQCCICEIQMIHFLVELCIMIRNESFPIVTNWLNGWIITKHPNTFQN